MDIVPGPVAVHMTLSCTGVQPAAPGHVCQLYIYVYYKSHTIIQAVSYAANR